MDPQLAPYFTAVETSKAAVVAARAALVNAQAALDAAVEQNKKDGETLVEAVKTVYEVS